jgi:hypothetical protein
MADMQPNEHNTRPRYSERDLHNERKALAARIRTLAKPNGPPIWNKAIEAAAAAVEI